MNILLSAYLDHNLGDDLFVDYFATKYCDHKILLICDSEMILNPQIEAHKNIEKVGLKQAVKGIYKIDVYVIIGGSIFQDIPDFYRYDYRRNALVTIARLLGKKVFIIGCNIGPIHSRKGELIFKYCFFMANRVSVRDSASFKLLGAWGSRKNYMLAPDLVFSYPYVPPPINANIHGRLGISIINTRRESESKSYIKKIAKLIDAYLELDARHKVCLFGFDGGHENDAIAIQRVMGEVSADRHRIELFQYEAGISINQFIDCFLSCDYVVCSRFHALVLALKYKIKFFPIAYSEKTTNLLKDIGYTGRVGEYASMENFDVDFVLNDIAKSEVKFVISDSYVLESGEHFSNFSKYAF